MLQQDSGQHTSLRCIHRAQEVQGQVKQPPKLTLQHVGQLEARLPRCRPQLPHPQAGWQHGEGLSARECWRRLLLLGEAGPRLCRVPLALLWRLLLPQRRLLGEAGSLLGSLPSLLPLEPGQPVAWQLLLVVVLVCMGLWWCISACLVAGQALPLLVGSSCCGSLSRAHPVGVLLLLVALVAMMLLAGGRELLEAPDSSSAVGCVGVVAGRRLAKAPSSPALALEGGEPLLTRGLGRRLGLLLHRQLLPARLPTLLLLQPAGMWSVVGRSWLPVQCCPTKAGSPSVMC